MIVRVSSFAARVAFVCIAAALAVYLIYFSVRSARATYYGDLQTLSGYERVAQIEPGNPRNWYQLGRFLQYDFDDPNPQRAIRVYKTALEIDPRATLTWLDLAGTYESEGDAAAARNAYLNAKKSYPLSAEVAWRYGNFLLRQGEKDAAFLEIRHSVEADPDRAPEAFSRCVQAEPNANIILDRVLPATPNVYVSVIQDLTADQQIENALVVWNRLYAMHPALPLSEALRLVLTLRDAGRNEAAHKVWLQAAELAGLSNLEGQNGSALWDGGFESDVTGAGTYTWRFSRIARSAQIGFDDKEKHSGARSLRVTFDGSADVEFRDVCQYVPVEGGIHYQLSGWMRTRDLTTDQGVHIELRPLAPGAAQISTPDVRGTQPWTQVAETWLGSVAPQEVEICLHRAASDQEDNKIRGAVWVDDLALTPLPPKSAAKP